MGDIGFLFRCSWMLLGWGGKVAHPCCGRKVCPRAVSQAQIHLQGKRKRYHGHRGWRADGRRRLLTWTKVNFQARNSHLRFRCWPHSPALGPASIQTRRCGAESVGRSCRPEHQAFILGALAATSTCRLYIGCWEPQRGGSRNQ